ncbi:hypothetical protein [Pseudoduganella sp. GCM10020061]|uniref:hypothetical protein n=1 Tax=Pseudoduganella sp. GCM10020061 TaxID=3317345 RepID=UPI00363625CF
MQIVFFFLFLLLVLGMLAAVAKFAVFLSRSGTLSWKHSLFFAGFLFTLSMAIRVFLNFYPLPEELPPLVRAGFGLALTTTFAAFFFRHHIVAADGAAVSRAAGIKAAGVWAGLFILLAIPMVLLAPRP